MSHDAWPYRILLAIDHVQAHLEEDLTPDLLAGIAGFSRHHFHRVFRGLTGETVMGFVRRLRLERAAGRLVQSEAPITEIALRSGYGSHEAFTRAFRARFGTSPRTYRSQHVGEGGPPPFRVTDWPEQRTIALRAVGSYDETGPAWERLLTLVHAQGLDARVRGMLGLCYDDPEVTPTERLRYDACVVLAGDPPVALPADVTPRVVPGGPYAVAMHRGPYDTLSSTYVGLLGRALPFRGVELTADPVVERYLNDPTDTAPADLLTEIGMRIDPY